MRKRKRIVKTVATLLAIGLALAILIRFAPLSLVKARDREISYTLPISLSNQVSNESIHMDIEQIIDYSLSLTASQLRFATRNDIPSGKANCIGYAQLCAAICNRAMAENRIEGKARPVVGYIESNGINWCKVLKAIAPKASYKNFVKDHDFVELTAGSRKYYFDPSIYDVLGKKCLSISNKTHKQWFNQSNNTALTRDKASRHRWRNCRMLLCMKLPQLSPHT